MAPTYKPTFINMQSIMKYSPLFNPGQSVRLAGAARDPVYPSVAAAL